MKKFGTPIGAAPGSAKEKVGFAALGAPFAEVCLPDFFAPELADPVPLPLGFPPELLEPPLFGLPELWLDPPCELGCCCWGWPVWWGGVWVWLLVVVVDVEVEVDDDDDEDDDDDDELPVVVVGGGAGGGGHDSEDETIPATPRLEAGVPGATWKVSTLPPSSVTVSVHVSACATGIAARA